MRWRFWLLILGIALIFFGGMQEIALWRVGGREPARRSCAELVQYGPGPNVHLLLTDARLLSSAFVYEVRGRHWSVAWVPAVPEGLGIDRTAPELLEQVAVLVKLPRARSMADVLAAAEAEQLQGMVVNEIESLGPEEQARLERQYPGVDFARCWIFEVGRRPSSLWLVAASLLVGTMMVLYVLWSMVPGSSCPNSSDLRSRGS